MKIATLITACLLSLSTITIAGDDKPNLHPNKYCVKMKDGKLTVMHEGQPITATVTLDNGTQIMTDGTVVKKDGSKTMMKEGECADKEGKIMKEKSK